MIHDCQNRPIGMSVGEWCEAHSITKANYYYRMTEVRKACLEQTSIQMPEQAIRRSALEKFQSTWMITILNSAKSCFHGQKSCRQSVEKHKNLSLKNERHDH